MKKIVFFFVLILSTSPLFATTFVSGSFKDYQKVTPDKHYVLVMLLPQDLLVRDTSCHCPPNALCECQFLEYKTDKNLRTKYTISGLYKNDGSTKPLWELEGYAPQKDVFVASEGIYLVVINREVCLERAQGAKGDSAGMLKDLAVVAFFENGKRIKDYRSEDLKMKEWPKDCTVPYKARFLKGADQFEVETYDHFFYTFDVRSGSLILKEYKKPSLWKRIKRLYA